VFKRETRNFFYSIPDYKNVFVGPILGILGTLAHFRHFLPLDIFAGIL
jgi:hypothetical protein